MDMDFFVKQYLLSVAIYSPMLLVYLLAFGIATTWTRRSPRAAMLTMFAALTLILVGLMAPAVSLLAPNLLSRESGGMDVHRMVLYAVGGIRNLIAAAATFVLVIAIFTDRAQAGAAANSPFDPQRAK